MGVPSVQASYMKNVAASLERLGAAGEAVRRADPSLFEEIAAAPRGVWLPVSYNVRWVEAVAKSAGWPGAMTFLAARVQDQFEAPLLRSFVQGSVRLFGLDPGSLVPWLPRGMGLVFRDCGDWSSTRVAPGHVEIRAEDLPKELAGEARWIESIGAGAIATFALCRVAGETQLAAHDAAAGTASISVRWSVAPNP